VTAEAVGSAEATVALCVKYAKERIQFGSPIGRYQGVKHPLAEMHVDVESFKSLLYYAAWCLDESPEEAPRYVSMAKAYASEAFARIGIDAVQLHGAVGYTWEYDVHLYLKRAKWVRAMYGDADWHYERVARLGGV
jgi:acyl-CoA dehydrogenase